MRGEKKGVITEKEVIKKQQVSRVGSTWALVKSVHLTGRGAPGGEYRLDLAPPLTPSNEEKVRDLKVSWWEKQVVLMEGHSSSSGRCISGALEGSWLRPCLYKLTAVPSKGLCLHLGETENRCSLGE